MTKRRCLIGTVRYRASVQLPVQLPTVFRSPTWHTDAICSPPLVISSSCCRTVYTHFVFWRFLYSVRESGTLCLDCCVTSATTPRASICSQSCESPFPFLPSFPFPSPNAFLVHLEPKIASGGSNVTCHINHSSLIFIISDECNAFECSL